MDWPRARAVLLVTFTVANCLLAYQIWGPPGAQPVADLGLAALELRAATSRLAQQGFALQAEMPPYPSKVLPFLRLSAPGDGLGPREVALAPRGEVRLDNRAEVRRVAEAALAQVPLPPGVVLQWLETRPGPEGSLAVTFVPHYQGLPVFAGWATVWVGPRGAEAVRYLLPLVEGFRGEPKGILAPTEAVLRLAGALAAGGGAAPRPRAFTAVALGYYAPQLPAARAWEAVPAWRIATDTGAVYYVNAFTGEVETP